MNLNILKSKDLSIYINELHEKGDLVKILPELNNLHTTTGGHKNNFIHTLGVLNNVIKYDNDNLKMKIVALLHDIGKIVVRSKNKDDNWTFHDHEKIGAKMVFDILKRFNVTNKKTINYVYRMVKFHGRVKIHRDVTESAIRRLDTEVGQDIILELIEFCKCDITTRKEENRNRIVSGLDEIRKRILEVRQKDDEAKWRSPVTGIIIMETLGLKSGGRIVGDIKKVTDEKFKSGEWTFEQAMDYVKSFK
jgi:poly(A) polymerase